MAQLFWLSCRALLLHLSGLTSLAGHERRRLAWLLLVLHVSPLFFVQQKGLWSCHFPLAHFLLSLLVCFGPPPVDITHSFSIIFFSLSHVLSLYPSLRLKLCTLAYTSTHRRPSASCILLLAFPGEACLLIKLLPHLQASGAMLEIRQLFLLSLSLFHNDEAIEGKENREEMVWSLRKLGAASAALVVFVLFSSPGSWNAVSSLVLDLDELVEVSASQSCEVYQCSNLSSFKTAPAFRNEKTCAVSVRDIGFVCDPASMHIALTLDAAYLRGSMAVIHSILQHASCPETIVFHFLVSDADEEFRSLIKSTFPYLKFKIYHFNDGLVRNRISSSVRQALEQPLNYARNYLADILEPCVRRVIYLDSDLVVVDDIAKLWGTSLSSKTLGAPEYCHANFSKYFTSSFWSNKTLADTFKGRSTCYFNTGVMIIDLVKWRQKRYTLKIEKWMEIQKDKRIYELGSLPPFLLVFAGLIEPVEHRWNQHGLGGDNVKGSCRPLHPGPVSLLHWSGTGKPWIRLDSGRPCPLDSLWLPYDLYASPAQSHI